MGAVMAGLPQVYFDLDNRFGHPHDSDTHTLEITPCPS